MVCVICKQESNSYHHAFFVPVKDHGPVFYDICLPCAAKNDKEKVEYDLAKTWIDRT